MLAKTNSDTWKNATVDRNVTNGFIQGCIYLEVHQPGFQVLNNMWFNVASEQYLSDESKVTSEEFVRLDL